jgi:hypothetical protein
MRDGSSRAGAPIGAGAGENILLARAILDRARQLRERLDRPRGLRAGMARNELLPPSAERKSRKDGDLEPRAKKWVSHRSQHAIKGALQDSAFPCELPDCARTTYE